ncbi:MAG: outer membrane beta-barrel protein [Rhodobacteraceae bacterium]|jgi:opacity protein-like surface antigen|nr:outer membrane beta-barrel protein [Paracoccaceae bacterium]
MLPRSFLTAGALVLGATSLSAQSLPDGYYLQGFAGYSQLDDTSFSGSIGGAPQSVTGDFDDGFGLGLSVGREITRWSNDTIGTRLELELSYRNNDVSGLNFSGNGPGAETNVSGDVSSTSIFANVLFDFKQTGAWTPFAGFGVGATRSDLDLVYGPGVRIDGDDTNFAAQAIAGVSYALNDQTSIVFDARYARAFDVSSPRLSPAGALTGTVEDDLSSFNLNVGVRFNF